MPASALVFTVKALLRKAQARTVQGLWDAVGRLLEEFSAEECGNYIHHSGYCGSG